MKKAYMVVGTDTGVGKTFVSIMLALKMGANYFKPIQSGTPTDSDFVRKIIGETRVFSETYRLRFPLSVNQAAEIDNVCIDINKISVDDKRDNTPLIVETAGGVMSPINDRHSTIDLVTSLALDTILVARSGLGTLNHTLISAQALLNNGAKLKAIILFGAPHDLNKRDIKQKLNLSTIYHTELSNTDWETL